MDSQLVHLTLLLPTAQRICHQCRPRRESRQNWHTGLWVHKPPCGKPKEKNVKTMFWADRRLVNPSRLCATSGSFT